MENLDIFWRTVFVFVMIGAALALVELLELFLSKILGRSQNYSWKEVFLFPLLFVLLWPIGAASMFLQTAFPKTYVRFIAWIDRKLKNATKENAVKRVIRYDGSREHEERQ